MAPQRDAPPISPSTLRARLVAPCGMNCGLCIGFQRTKDRCPGCDRFEERAGCTTTRCVVRRCRERAGRFCTGCPRFPCARLRRLDLRYRTRYGMSPLENLAAIQAGGIRAFVAAERERWACERCGSLLTVHRAACPSCGTAWREAHGPDGLRR